MTVVNRLVVCDFANGTSKIHTALLANDAILDLSCLNVAWIPQSVFDSATDYVTFSENAKIRVDMGGRSLKAIAFSDDPYVVKWDSAPLPPVTTTFEMLNDISRNYRLRVDENGLKLVYIGGTEVLIR